MKPTNFSIIVPIYNTAPYLPRCIDSVINQGYDNLEVILIDDGSTDLSPTLCDEYTQKDSRIKVIHKQNEGLSAARNDGILAATGDYILFVDSDDYIMPHTFTTFDTAIQKHPELDVLTSNHNKTENNTIKYHRFYSIASPISGYDFLKIQKSKGKMMVSPCVYISRLSFIKDHDLFFPKDIREASDNLWCYRVLLTAKKVFTLDFVHYQYIIRPGSITQSKNNVYRGLCLIKIAHLLEKDIELIDDNQMKALMMDHLIGLFFRSFYFLRSSDKWDEYSHLFDKKMINKQASSTKQKRNVFLYSISPNLYYYYKKSKVYIKALFKK